MVNKIVFMLMILSLAFLLNCSKNEPEETANPNQMAYLCSQGIYTDYSSINNALDYTDGFEPDWDPSSEPGKDTLDEDPVFDSSTGWWYVYKEYSEGVISYTYSESLQFIDTLGNISKNPYGLDNFLHRLHFMFGMDSLIMEGGHDLAFYGLNLDSSRVDSSTINGIGDWSVSLNEMVYTNTIIYNDLLWIWNEDNPCLYNDYPESGSYSAVINGAWNATLIFNGTNIAAFNVSDGDDTWYYRLNLQTGQLTYVSGPT